MKRLKKKSLQGSLKHPKKVNEDFQGRIRRNNCYKKSWVKETTVSGNNFHLWGRGKNEQELFAPSSSKILRGLGTEGGGAHS